MAEGSIRRLLGEYLLKKSHPIIQQGGRGAVVCCLPDGIDSRVTALVVFDELCNTKAKHLELPCGLSIWPTPYLPEPDAPKQLWAKQHEWFIEEGRCTLCTRDLPQALIGKNGKSYEYARDINPAAMPACVRARAGVCVICEIICVWPTWRKPLRVFLIIK